MQTSQEFDRYLFTETEAASRLGVTLEELHRVLDEHLFTREEPRPAECQFRSADLVLISYWLRREVNMKVLRMPRRN
jgi:hypothetical protein